MAYVRVPDQAKPGLSPMAQKALAAKPPASGTPELRFVMPTETYAGDVVWGEVIGVESGSELPYRGSLGPRQFKVPVWRRSLTARTSASPNRSAGSP